MPRSRVCGVCIDCAGVDRPTDECKAQVRSVDQARVAVARSTSRPAHAPAAARTEDCLARVLIIEPDRATRQGLVTAFAAARYVTSETRTAQAGLAAAIQVRPELVLLGSSLPDMPGLELIALLRERVGDVAVMVVSSQDDDSALITALDAGADAYVITPCSAGLLLARARAVQRRARHALAHRPAWVLGGLRVELRGRSAVLDGRPLELSRKEFDLLAYLAERAGHVVSKQELLTQVWHLPPSASGRTVDVYVSWLRRKLGESAHSPRYLHTLRGVGLRLDFPD